jgi:hypothetical protein
MKIMKKVRCVGYAPLKITGIVRRLPCSIVDGNGLIRISQALFEITKWVEPLRSALECITVRLYSPSSSGGVVPAPEGNWKRLVRMGSSPPETQGE